MLKRRFIHVKSSNKLCRGFCLWYFGSWAVHPSESMVLEAGPGLSSVECFVSLTPLKIPGRTHTTGSTQDRVAAHWMTHLSNSPSKFRGRSKDPATLCSWYFISSISWNAINAAGKGCEEFSWFGLHWLTEISVWNCGREKLDYCSNFIWSLWGPHCHALYLTALCCYWTSFADLLRSLEIMFRPACLLLCSRMCEAAVCWTSIPSAQSAGCSQGGLWEQAHSFMGTLENLYAMQSVPSPHGLCTSLRIT